VIGVLAQGAGLGGGVISILGSWLMRLCDPSQGCFWAGCGGLESNVAAMFQKAE